MKSNYFTKYLIGTWVLVWFNLSSQNMDSLKKLFVSAQDDSVKCCLLELMIEAEYDDNIWPEYNEELFQISSAGLLSNDSKANRRAYFFKKMLGYSYSNKGLIAHQKGDLKEAITNYNRSLELATEIDYIELMGLVYNNLGGVMSVQRKFNESIEYLKKSLELRRKTKDKDGEFQSVCNLATSLSALDRVDEAISLLESALADKTIREFPERLAVVYTDLGGFYINKKYDYKKAEEYLVKASEIYHSQNNKRGICSIYYSLSELYIAKKDFDLAKQYGEKGFELANELGYPELIGRQCMSLFQIESQLKNWESALKYYILGKDMKDSINNIENAKSAIQLSEQNKYEQQKAIDKAVADKELLIANERESKQKLISVFILVGLLIVIVLSLIIFQRLKVTRKQKEIIEIQKTEVERKNKLIEEKQKEILDSIRYAKRIQMAHIPSEKSVERMISNSGKNNI